MLCSTLSLSSLGFIGLLIRNFAPSMKPVVASFSLSLSGSLLLALSLSLSLRLSPTILEEVKTLDTFFLFIYLNRRHGSNTDTTRPLPLPAELLIIFTLGSIHQCKSTKNFFLLALFFVFFSQKANLKEKKNR